jgi:Cysteine dioxygenase type I
MQRESRTAAGLTEVAAWVVGRVPPDQDLDRAQLTTLSARFAAERSLWEHLVHHDPEERYFAELYRDVHLDVWLICWMNQQDTGYHDHDLSSGAVHVCDGTLIEDRLQAVDGVIRSVTRERPAGTGFDFDASHVHRMHHVSGGPATSIHCYSPALWRLGHYDFDADGNLCRTSITYADEMWTGRIVGVHGFSPE